MFSNLQQKFQEWRQKFNEERHSSNGVSSASVTRSMPELDDGSDGAAPSCPSGAPKTSRPITITEASATASTGAHTSQRIARRIERYDIESNHTFYKDDTHVYKTFNFREPEMVAGWLFEILHRKILARMDAEVAAALTSAHPVIVDGRLAIKVKKYAGDLQSWFPTPARALMDVARLLTKLTIGMQTHGLLWIDLKPEQLVLTSRDTLRLVDLEDVFTVKAWMRQRGQIWRGTLFYLSPEERRGLGGSGYESHRTPADAAAIATYRLGITLLTLAVESPSYSLPEDHKSRLNHAQWVDDAILEGKCVRKAIATQAALEHMNAEVGHSPLRSPLRSPAYAMSHSPTAEDLEGHNLPPAFWEFVRACLAKDPAKRPTGAALVDPKAPWGRLFPPSTAALIQAKTRRSDDAAAEYANAHTTVATPTSPSVLTASPSRPSPIHTAKVSKVSKVSNLAEKDCEIAKNTTVHEIFRRLFEDYDKEGAKKLLCTLDGPEDLLVHVDAWTSAQASLFFASPHQTFRL